MLGSSAIEWSGIHGMPAIVEFLPPIEHTVVREGLECRGCWPRWLLEPWIRGRQHSSATEPATGDLFYMWWWAASALHCRRAWFGWKDSGGGLFFV